MPADVIKRVNRMARKSRSGLTFGDRHNADDPDDESDDDDSDYTPDRVSTNIDVEIDDAEDDIDMVNNGTSDDDHDDIETPGVIPPETDEGGQNHDDDHQQDQDATAYDSKSDGQESDNTSTEESDPDSEDEQDNEPTTRSGRAVRTTQREDYVYTSIGSDPKSLQCAQFLQKTQDMDIDLSQQKTKKLNSHKRENFLRTTQFMEASDLRSNVLLQYAMAQMSVSKGIKTRGDAGKASAMKEINNLVVRDCFGEVEYKSLTPKQRKLSLPILMFMTMKRDGTLKTRGCADGRPQRLWTNKQDVSSPTPAIECIKYILAIIAFKRRDVASFDLPAQFLQTEMNELLHLRITGAVALLLVESDPKRWKKHLRNE